VSPSGKANGLHLQAVFYGDSN